MNTPTIHELQLKHAQLVHEIKDCEYTTDVDDVVLRLGIVSRQIDDLLNEKKIRKEMGMRLDNMSDQVQVILEINQDSYEYNADSDGTIS